MRRSRPARAPARHPAAAPRPPASRSSGSACCAPTRSRPMWCAPAAAARARRRHGRRMGSPRLHHARAWAVQVKAQERDAVSGSAGASRRPVPEVEPVGCKPTTLQVCLITVCCHQAHLGPQWYSRVDPEPPDRCDRACGPAAQISLPRGRPRRTTPTASRRPPPSDPSPHHLPHSVAIN